MSQSLYELVGSRALFAANTTAEVRKFTLDDVVLDADSLLLFKDGALLPESEYFAPPHASRSISDPGTPPPDDDGSDVILGYNCAHYAYQHWLTQCLPAIDWCVRQQEGQPVRLLLPALEPWQEDLLRLLGHDRIPRITPAARTRYRLQRLHFAEFLIGVHTFAVSLSFRQTIDRILAAVPPAPATDAILYVPGSNFYYGVLSNEAELMVLLRGYGVRIVEPALPTNERINLFRNAQVVIGPVGQGLSDVAFCRPGTLLWEWMPRHHLNPSYNRLAQAGRVDYLADVFPVVPGPVLGTEWRAEPELIQQRMDQINARLARLAGAGAAVTTQPAAPPLAAIGTEADEDAGALETFPTLLAETVETPAAPDAGEPDSDSLDLFRCFEPLGDGPEFGLVQRRHGVEPLSLFRFARFDASAEERLGRLVAALEHRLEGFGAPDTVTVAAQAVGGTDELVTTDSRYGLLCPAGVAADGADAATMAESEAARLRLLGAAQLKTLTAGDRICVWRSPATTQPEQLEPLLSVLRRLGPNTLLWVCDTDDPQLAGRLEVLDSDFVRGFVRQPADAANGAGIDFAGWRQQCEQALQWWRTRPVAEPERREQSLFPAIEEPGSTVAADTTSAAEVTDGNAAPAATETGSTQAPAQESGTPLSSADAHPATAMDYLRRSAVDPQQPAQVPPSARKSLLRRLFGG
ncbi:MAG TPA: glycosyltransferase 61 family protein [Rhodopila sp.]|nr:glycosyltransferase 61 family protein [Rhodopila sp.]